MTYVAKTTAQLYRVYVEGEYAAIVVDGWRREQGGRLHQGCELLVHSSFGSWAHQWTNIASPAKEFLAHSTFETIMGKLMGGRLREFDFHASLNAWKRQLVATRRMRMIDSDQFSEIWDASCMNDPCGIELFMQRLEQSRPLGVSESVTLWDCLNSFAVNRYSVQAESFWRTVWPHFVSQLTREITPANEKVYAYA